VVVDVDITDE